MVIKCLVTAGSVTKCDNLHCGLWKIFNWCHPTHAFEAKNIYSRHFQVDLPCHGLPSGIGSQHSSLLGDSADRRGLQTYNMFGSKMY